MQELSPSFFQLFHKSKLIPNGKMRPAEIILRMGEGG
jgi:hypothetical protein